MKLKKWALAYAFISPCINAFEVCNIGEEYNVLDRDVFHELRKSNYRGFSENLTPNDLFLSVPDHSTDVRPSLIETQDVFPETALLLESGPAGATLLGAEETTNLLSTLGRSTLGALSGVFEALGPVGDTVAVGLWAKDVAQTFDDETKTSYDRFASVMGLIDWFGVLKIPEREIDRMILTARWNRVAAGDHYSYTVHEDIISQQDKKDKQHWADLSSGQQSMLEAVAIGYASDVALKYQLYYQEGVKAQSQIVTTLINAVESELDKSFLALLATTDSETKLFSSELSNACRIEIDALEALYPEQEQNNSYPSVTPSIREANRRLANLQHCQQNQLNLVIAKLEMLVNGNVDGLDHLTVRQLYRRVLNAKINIVETANQQLADVGTKLKAHMRAEGLSAIDRLFDSGAVEQAHSYFIQQAEAVAIDEMSRSLFGRPATERERNNKYFIIQAGYETCSRIGMLAGDPNFVGCTQYSWIPEERKHFDPSKDDVISRMVMPTRDAIKRFFLQSLEQLILNGWNNLHEEAWLERQIISFSEKQRILKKAETDRALVMRWLFDSTKEIAEECGSGNACAAWSSSYLAGQKLSPHSSLQHIASWYESNKNSNLYVHSARLAKLDGLIRSALESEWQANHVNSFYSYIFPGSFDLEKHAPLIASALNASGLDTTHLASALPLAKSVVKTRLSEAMSVADSNGEEWLLTQIGDFQRYLAIVHNQHISTGHFASGEVGTTTLFSELLPAHLLRYMTLDFYHTIDGDNFDEYYFPITGEAPSYDARLFMSIDDLFNPQSSLGKKLAQLTKVNARFSDAPGRSCDVDYSELKAALLAVSGDESVYWLKPIADWLDSIARHQMRLFGEIRAGVIAQNKHNIRCDLSPNNLMYWY